MKAIIELAKRGSVFDAARAQHADGAPVDFHLSFESARTLFSELTPARMELLETLRRAGPCSIYALAKAAGRNYSNVHTDVARLLDLGLVERQNDETVFVPFEAIEIRMPLPLAE
jgi:predicted transcriptional regulator